MPHGRASISCCFSPLWTIHTHTTTGARTSPRPALFAEIDATCRPQSRSRAPHQPAIFRCWWLVETWREVWPRAGYGDISNYNYDLGGPTGNRRRNQHKASSLRVPVGTTSPAGGPCPLPPTPQRPNRRGEGGWHMYTAERPRGPQRASYRRQPQHRVRERPLAHHVRRRGRVQHQLSRGELRVDEALRPALVVDHLDLVKDERLLPRPQQSHLPPHPLDPGRHPEVPRARPADHPGVLHHQEPEHPGVPPRRVVQLHRLQRRHPRGRGARRPQEAVNLVRERHLGNHTRRQRQPAEVLPPGQGRRRRDARLQARPGLEEVLGVHRERGAELLEVRAEAPQPVREEGEADPRIPHVIPVEGAKVLEDADAFQRGRPKGYLAGEFCGR